MQSNINIYSDIFKVIRTNEEAQQCIGQIGSLLEALYEVDGKTSEQHIREIFPPRVSDAIFNSLQKSGIQHIDNETCKTFFSGLEETLKQAKQFELTIAIQPDDVLLDSICSLLQEIFPQTNMLLAIKVKPSLIGGAEVVWEGRYWNFGLDKQITEWFQAQKNQLSTA